MVKDFIYGPYIMMNVTILKYVFDILNLIILTIEKLLECCDTATHLHPVGYQGEQSNKFCP